MPIFLAKVTDLVFFLMVLALATLAGVAVLSVAEKEVSYAMRIELAECFETHGVDRRWLMKSLRSRLNDGGEEMRSIQLQIVKGKALHLSTVAGQSQGADVKRRFDTVADMVRLLLKETAGQGKAAECAAAGEMYLEQNKPAAGGRIAAVFLLALSLGAISVLLRRNWKVPRP